MAEMLGVDKSVSLELILILYKQYGTTTAGLRAAGYQFDYNDFHSFVHGRLAYEKLTPMPPTQRRRWPLLLRLRHRPTQERYHDDPSPFRFVIFLKNDGLVNPEAIKMEGIAGDEYQKLAAFVFD